MKKLIAICLLLTLASAFAQPVPLPPPGKPPVCQGNGAC